MLFVLCINNGQVEEDKTRKIGGGDHKGTHQQERCVFCLENAKWTNHLIVSIANFTYLTLPHSKPVVPGHCCILPLQVRLNWFLILNVKFVYFLLNLLNFSI